MYSRSAKGGEKGDPNRNPWLAKMPVYIINKHCKALASSFLNEFKYVYNNKDFIKYTLLTGNICIFDLKQNYLYQI